MEEAIQKGQQQYQHNLSKDNQLTYYHAAKVNQTTPLAEFARAKKISVHTAAKLWNQQKGVFLPYQSRPPR